MFAKGSTRMGTYKRDEFRAPGVLKVRAILLTKFADALGEAYELPHRRLIVGGEAFALGPFR